MILKGFKENCFKLEWLPLVRLSLGALFIRRFEIWLLMSLTASLLGSVTSCSELPYAASFVVEVPLEVPLAISAEVTVAVALDLM